jgi:hypothetical protein
METKSTQQEILFFTNTRFSSRLLSEKSDNQQPAKEMLEDACWNGLITQVLPEICETPGDITLTLWEINVANSFIDLKFSEYPSDVEKESSVDPYRFMEVQCMN